MFSFCSSIAFPIGKRAMTPPSAFSVLRNRAAVAAELRLLLPKMEGVRNALPIPLGVAAIDRCLPQGGLAGGALHEIVPDRGATPAAFGFLVALLVRISSPPPCGEGLGVGVERYCAEVDVARAEPPPYPAPQGGRNPANRSPLILVLPSYGLRDYGRPHCHGLNALGLDPRRLILVETAHRKDTLWAMEQSLHSRAVAAIAGVIDQLDLKASQRLQLAAMDAGTPLLVLRPADTLEGSTAATRWRVGTASAARDRFGLIARSRWQLRLERCRNGRFGEWMVEYDHVAHRFSLAAALADPAFPHRAGEARFSQAS
jgi:protein ImuA